MCLQSMDMVPQILHGWWCCGGFLCFLCWVGLCWVGHEFDAVLWFAEWYKG
jgi:hypothetical protein